MEALDQQRYRTKKSLPAGAIHICTLSKFTLTRAAVAWQSYDATGL